MTARGEAPDERGAIMLIALFFALFSLGMLYMVAAVAEASFHRMHLQDAADAAALSSAVMHARSMNFIVLVNIVMAALLAILVTIKLLQSIAIIGIAVAAALSWFTMGASLAAIPPLNVVQSQMQSAFNELKPPIFSALELLHTVADTVKTEAPLAAGNAAIDEIESATVASSGVVVPAEAELPVEDDTFQRLCDQAGQVPITIANDMLGGLPIFDALSEPIHGLTHELSSWFCGDDGKTPQPYPYSIEPVLPASEAVPACQASVPTTDKPEGAKTHECETALKVEKQARPDPDTGECNEEADCSLGGPYDQRVVNARSKCDPAKTAASKYYYQQRRGTVPYFWTGKTWLRGEPEYKPPTSENSGGPPCAAPPRSGLIGSTYEAVVRKTDDVNDVTPVCSNEKSPAPTLPPEHPKPGTPTFPTPGAQASVDFIEVRHILGCKVHEDRTLPVDVSGGQAGSQQSGSRSPKKVKDGTTLGDESFQVRAIMRSDFSSRLDRGVQIALDGRAPPGDRTLSLRSLGRFSVAQAEYFYDGTDGRDAWMWNMRWRARLRRFRLPSGKALETLHEACDELPSGEICGEFESAMSGLADFIAH